MKAFLRRLRPLRPAGVLAWPAAWLCALALAALAGPAQAQSTMNWGAPPSAGAVAPAEAATPEMAGFQQELQALLKARTEEEAARPATAAPTLKPRLEVILGKLDPRLRLAPCDKVRAFMPEGARLWGRTRVGLRCEQGAVHWNVYWPVTVKVWAPGLVAAMPLRAGATITEADLRIAEVDLAESMSPAVMDAADIVGRTMMRNVAAGDSLRQDDIKLRRWFSAGEPVKVLVKGKGFAVGAEGTALSHGDEGRCARIRIDSGRILCGIPVGERRVEVTL